MKRHYVGTVDDSKFATPKMYQPHSAKYTRLSLLDHTTTPATVHTGLSLAQFEPGGYLNPVVHAFEKGFYVLRGAIIATIDGRTYKLPQDYYGVIPMGVTYSMYNAGSEPARLLEMMAPQPKPEDGNFKDTFFHKDGAGQVVKDGDLPDLNDPRVAKHLGRFEESQLGAPGEISAVGARGGSIYGISLKEFIDRMLGAEHLAMFMVQFRPGGMGTQHDHALEESYFILSGEAETILDGNTYHVKAGDYVWTGVGCMHSFENIGDVPVRWIETQAPLPTQTQAFRFRREWEPLAKKIEGE
ncbi:MAG: cupin domain-containing protein [Chloroflexi bacterium]|nr:MAG: cupin domain-containing protein [Chloroflexota bacterium]